MAQPRLIHPVEVTIELFSPDQMVMDHDAREPVHGARSQPTDAIVLPCQVHFDKFQDPTQEPGGTVTLSNAYFLARSIDMDRIIGQGKRLKRGDRITQYKSVLRPGEVVKCDLFITRFDPMGHYPERGATLYKYTVEDRDPVM